MEENDSFRRLMKLAGEQWNRPAGRHLSGEEVYAYCRGEAPPETVPALREHLTQCPACLELYRDAADFQEIRQSEEALAPEVEGEWRRLRERLPQFAAKAPATPKPGWSGFPQPFRFSFGAALAAALVVIAIGVLAYVLSRRSALVPPVPVDVAGTSPTPTAAETPAVVILPSAQLPLSEELIVMEIRGAASSAEEDLVRSEREEAVAALRAGQRVLLEARGPSGLAGPFVRSLRRRLEVAGRFELTGDREAAQVALKLTVREAAASGGAARLDVSASIVNASGKVIWPLEPRISERRYIGLEEKLLDRLVRDLLADVRP